MTIFLLSLGGFPPMAGFIAKWYVFSAAIKAGYSGLAIIGVLTSVVSVFFYLRIVVMMYMTPSETPARFPPVPRMAGIALSVSAMLISISASCRRASSTGRPRRSRRFSDVAQPFRAAAAAIGRPQGLRYETFRAATDPISYRRPPRQA